MNLLLFQGADAVSAQATFNSVGGVLQCNYSVECCHDPNHELKGQGAPGITTTALNASITTPQPQLSYTSSLSVSISLSLSLFPHTLSLAHLDIKNSTRMLARSRRPLVPPEHSAVHLKRITSPPIPLGDASLIPALCSIHAPILPR